MYALFFKFKKENIYKHTRESYKSTEIYMKGFDQ